MDEFERTIFTDNYLASLAIAPHKSGGEVLHCDHLLANDVLESVIAEVTQAAKIEDRWEGISSLRAPGAWAYGMCKTAETKFSVGLTIEHPGRVLFRCSFANGEALPLVDERFWSTLLELTTKHRGQYHLPCWPGGYNEGYGQGRGEAALSKAKSGAALSMAVDYILLTRAERRGATMFPAGPIGVLKFEWPWTGKWQPLVPRLVEVTATAWQMSRSLHTAAVIYNQLVKKIPRRRKPSAASA